MILITVSTLGYPALQTAENKAVLALLDNFILCFVYYYMSTSNLEGTFLMAENPTLVILIKDTNVDT